MSDFYWVGDSGDWSDYTNHWSDVSGGTPNVYINAPDINDTVIFDENSFSGAGTVNIDATSCAGIFRAGNVTNNPKFIGTSNLEIGGIMTGEFTLGTVDWDFTGDIYISGLVPLTSAGNTLNNAIYVGVAGGAVELTLQDNLTCGYISLSSGLVDYNNKNVTAIAIDAPLGSAGTMLFGNGSFNVQQLQYNNAVDYNNCVLNLGGATIVVGTVGFGLSDVGTVTDFTAGSSSIYLISDEITFAGGGLTYNNVYLQGGSISVTGGNTFGYLELTAGELYKFEAGETQTLNAISFDGSGTANLTTLRSITNNSRFIFSKSSGTVSVQYVDIKDSQATGGALFIARDSTDSGNNLGWGFNGFNVALSDSFGLADNIDYTTFSYRGKTLGKKPFIDSVINLQPKVGYRYSYKVRK